MKEDQINLSSPAKTEKKVERYVTTPSFIIFVLVFLLAAVFLIYSLFLESNLSNLEAQAESVKSQIAQASLKKQKILVASERLGALDGILKSRSKLDEVILYILSIVPDSFLIDRITADNKGMSVTLDSQNLADFARLFEEDIPKLVTDNNFGIKTVELRAFNQAVGGYEADVNFDFRGKDTPE